ncbi:hypothetical protein PIB19_19165 [Sphingomonas sp. 7/4-4]|uniref:hypothetical protein n=1 Tax=Sphingomonas sp. 7/4-4 TaxID=3018446 RepID=UPI0022F3BDC8|nr:hypothetical protein [Sphingomonas sp. 7/4-4]WBY07446.1 hypothetical protein PIB19_19165 [Sphingomonas sp. 7/4-4]
MEKTCRNCLSTAAISATLSGAAMTTTRWRSSLPPAALLAVMLPTVAKAIISSGLNRKSRKVGVITVAVKSRRATVSALRSIRPNFMPPAPALRGRRS